MKVVLLLFFWGTPQNGSWLCFKPAQKRGNSLQFVSTFDSGPEDRLDASVEAGSRTFRGEKAADFPEDDFPEGTLERRAPVHVAMESDVSGSWKTMFL